ncbi:serine hydrolase [Noviherbaspirillum saxi]|uniref:Serine hydrolase n=1 Tax=Noviherbaspirillum saxi TaxID=2320863 RepID=A0A3A3FKK5_9BURK|nr:serine hydrolase [Noviherbaspirillum saxi]RJF91865.1 serine hydrolase [Noviherbaspirillum saxi]
MDTDKFDRYVKSTMDSWHCPGASICIIREDEVIYQRAFGLRDTEKRLPLTEETRFPLGSVTKSITAMSAALLVDDGLLDWDKPVLHYMPEFILDDAYATRHVTVRDMLSHRTGLPRYDFASWRLNLPVSEFIKRMRFLKPSATFREKAQYTNIMYYAAGYLIEKIAGQRWDEFIAERIFSPLGMTASNFGPAFSGTDVPLAKGHRIERDDEGKFNRWTQLPFNRYTELSPGAAGALYSTLTDMIKWLKVHLGDGKFGDVRLVSKANLKQMHMPQMMIPTNDMGYAMSGLTMSAYGLGWMIRPYPYAAGTMISHDGTIEGHCAIVGFVPESKIGVIVLTNAYAPQIPHILLREAMDRARGLPSQDWSARFHQTYAPIFAAAGKGNLVSIEASQGSTPMSHPLEAYTGTYTSPGYPDFAVKLENGKLYGCTVGSMPWSELNHQVLNTFEWIASDWSERIKTRFVIDDNDEVGSVSLALAEGVPDIVFTRKPIMLSPETTSAISGAYDGDVEGLVFSISGKDGKIYWQQMNEPAIEARPCKFDGSDLELRVSQSRVLLIQTDRKFTHLVLQTPKAVYKATKR